MNISAWNIIGFQLVYNYFKKKKKKVEFLLPLNEPFIPTESRSTSMAESAILHCQFSAVSQNRQTEHWLWRRSRGIGMLLVAIFNLIARCH